MNVRESAVVYSQKMWEICKDAYDCKVRSDGVSHEGDFRGLSDEASVMDPHSLLRVVDALLQLSYKFLLLRK